MDRIKVIFRTSVIGIAMNVFIATFKMIVGVISGSIAIVMDGVNNFSDAASSLITIIGAALAGRPADKKHPFGYGRIEYFSALIISALVMYAGITALVEAVKSIISPEPVEYSTVTIIIVVVAIFIKLFLALFTKKQGEKVNSDALIASGKDAIMDVLVSTTTLIAIGIYKLWNVGIEGYLAVIIAIVIIKAGIELLMENISKIIGEPAEIDLVIEIKKVINSFEGVNGVYDLILNDYGPGVYFASVHVEVDEHMSAKKMDQLTREITDKVRSECDVIISAVGFYSKNEDDATVADMEKHVREVALSEKAIHGLHGFYVDLVKKHIRFDLVISFSADDRKAVFDDMLDKIQALYPDYDIKAGMDMDFNEL